MALSRNLRKTNRKILEHPKPAVIIFNNQPLEPYRFVNVLNFSIQGVLIVSDAALKKNQELHIMIFNVEFQQWDTFLSKVVWVQKDNRFHLHAGLQFTESVETDSPPASDPKNHITPLDLDFLLATKYLQTLPEKEVTCFLNCMKKKCIDSNIKPIETTGDSKICFLIQEGSCIRKNRRYTKGDWVGQIEFLTDAPPSSEALVVESKMVVWEISAKQFHTASLLYPAICHFLTHIFINSLEDSRKTAFRYIGDFKLTHYIGQGKNGVVYKAKHKTRDQKVAIKMVKHQRIQDKDVRNKIRHSVEKQKELDHPNIVPICDISKLYHTFFITTAYLDAESLASLLKRKPKLPLKRSLLFLQQIASALAFAHDHGTYHGNLNPRNIFILEDDTIKLTDFGLPPFPSENPQFFNNFTYYHCPENTKNKTGRVHCDIYSFGILSYELLTGEKPVSCDSVVKEAMDIETPFHKLITLSCHPLLDKRCKSMKALLSQLNVIEKQTSDL